MKTGKEKKRKEGWKTYRGSEREGYVDGGVRGRERQEEREKERVSERDRRTGRAKGEGTMVSMRAAGERTASVRVIQRI